MSSFRKRKNVVMCGGSPHFHYAVKHVGDNVVVSAEIVDSIEKLQPFAPTLDELLNAGVSVKEVSTSGILDSYDANDVPNLDKVIDDCINDVKSKTKKEK